MEKNNIEIARSFSKTIQLEVYSPVSVFCSAKCECKEEEFEAKSKELFEKCRVTVENDIVKIQNYQTLKAKPKKQSEPF